ncbi:MAG: EAL domain-containing protein [Gammaproteobacteria bacterium]|nr:EAL domain-containing protein [Gammaproteobacteria bacterium]
MGWTERPIMDAAQSTVVAGEMDLERYAALIGAGLGGIAHVALCSSEGVLLNCTRATGEDRIAQLVIALKENVGTAQGGASELRLWVESGVWRCLAPLHDVSSTCIGWMAAEFETAGGAAARGTVSALAAEPGERDRALLESVTRTLEHELRLMVEVTGLADQLGASYEQLNLLYDIDVRAPRSQQSTDVQGLRKLLNSMLSFLDITAVIMESPGDRLLISVGTDRNVDVRSSWRSAWERARPAILPTLESSESTLRIEHLSIDPRYAGLTAIGRRMICVPIRIEAGGAMGVLAVFSSREQSPLDSPERRLIELIAEQIAGVLGSFRDKLTGLYNRQGFLQCKSMLRPTNGGASGTLIYIDVDQLMVVNETCGYSAGDELLRQISTLITQQVREEDICARVMADEFAVLVTSTAEGVGERVAEKIRAEIEGHRFYWHEKLFNPTVTIGVVDLVDTDLEAALSNGETAAQVAKSAGGNRVWKFTGDDGAMVLHHGQMQWIPVINRALSNDEFVLYAQPIVPIRPDSNEPRHLEILLRLREQSGELISPFVFIGAAERYQLMGRVDRWVIAHAMQAAARHPELFEAGGQVMSINLSGLSLSDPTLLDHIDACVRDSGLPSSAFCFEITETATISHLSDAVTLIRRLKERGHGFALDDFGTGLSSLSYLKQLPVDYLKIDGAFVRGLLSDRINAAMVRSVTEMANVMELKTIAEFVENAAVLARLHEIGVDFAQGYGIGRPEPLNEYLAAQSRSLLQSPSNDAAAEPALSRTRIGNSG